MDMQQLISEIQKFKVFLMSPTKLDDLLKSVDEIVLERDTLISGFIRILRHGNFYITQETSDKNEVVLRLYKSKEEAQALVNDHLDTYDQMWDGCGCKVDYYS
jgi:hypothetical protein